MLALGEGRVVTSLREAPDYENSRVFTSYPVITFFAKDEQAAARMLYALDKVINGFLGVSTTLDEECYERVSDEAGDEPWQPDPLEADDV